MTSKASDPENNDFAFLSIIFAIGIAIFVLSSFIPGFAKGVIMGYEFGAGNSRFPLRMLIIRPVFLQKGETIQLEHNINLANAQIEINAYSSSHLLAIIFEAKTRTVITLRGNAVGVINFRSPEDGFYIFNTTITPSITNTVGCTNTIKDLWNSLIRNPTSCQNYTAQYSIILRDN